jgi:hypothetical protein
MSKNTFQGKKRLNSQCGLNEKGHIPHMNVHKKILKSIRQEDSSV